MNIKGKRLLQWPIRKMQVVVHSNMAGNSWEKYSTDRRQLI